MDGLNVFETVGRSLQSYKVGMDQKSNPRVVIVGAGFGGLLAARTLARYPVQIALIDRQNFHTFQPLLYQVATAGLSPGKSLRRFAGLCATGGTSKC